MTTLSLCGKGFISLVFGSVYIHTAEIFPTQVRTIGLSFCSFWARVGGVGAPFLVELVRNC